MNANELGPLMAATQQGDAAAYERLLRATNDWLQRFYSRRLPASAVDDAVQDTLLAVHEKRHTYDRSRPFGPWLGAIARYKWIDRLRALKGASHEPLGEEIASEDRADSLANAAVLHQMLATLKPAQSQVIHLVKIQGLSIQQAAARSGQSVSLVKVNIHRGLARLAALA